MKLSIAFFCSITLLFSCSEEQKQEVIGETSTGEVIQVSRNDDSMERAMQEARDSFGEFWKEVSEDYDRDSPILTDSMLKVYFSEATAPGSGEHLWISNIQYDGSLISGVVSSQPLDLPKPKQGEKVTFPLTQLSDWLIIKDGVAKGAYTVQVLRKRMSVAERAEHDSHYQFKFPKLK